MAPRDPPSPSATRVALAGLLALAVAMGIGRFAFTPLLPLLLAEGSVDLGEASWLATANYTGYLLGAIACTFQGWLLARAGWRGPAPSAHIIRGGLVVTALLTMAMALPLPAAWAGLRFAAGVSSAFVLLFTAAWCLEQLARRGAASMGALIFAGPGAGIVVSGLGAGVLVGWHVPAAVGWLALGTLAIALTWAVWGTFGPDLAAAATASAGPSAATSAGAGTASGAEMALLTTAYGLAGLGYIVSATFLPVIARESLPQSAWVDLFWPLCGLAAMVGAISVSRWHLRGDLRVRLAACYLLQALGVAAGQVSATLGGFALGSVMLGLPFTAITFFAMQEVRRGRPAQAASWMGLLTAAYGIGQIVGPPLAAALVRLAGNAASGFRQSLWIACGALVLGALLFLVLARLRPLRTT